MKKSFFSLLFVLLALSGCTTSTNATNVPKLYIHNDYIYNTGTSCENETDVTYINNYESSRKHQTHIDYDESFFENNSLIYVTDITASSRSVITIESLFNYEDTTHMMFTDSSALTSGQCYNYEIEVEGKLLNPAIELHKSRPGAFKGIESDNKFTFFFLDNEENYLIYQDSNQYSISTFDYIESDNIAIIDNFNTHIGINTTIEIEIKSLELQFEFNGETFELNE